MENTQLTPYFIAIGCLLAFVLISIIVLLVVTYQRKMLAKEYRIQLFEQEKQMAMFKASFEAEELQKRIIANNLHDSINPTLTFLKYSLTMHQSNFQEQKFSHKDLEKDKELITQTIDNIRAICHDLNPVVLNDFGLIKSLEHCIEILNDSATLKATFKTENLSPEHQYFSETDQVNIYRICQELLNNIIKHSESTEMQLLIFSIEKKLCIEFTHNGQGIINEDIESLSKKGLGLNSLKSRALILNATLNYIKTDRVSIIKLHIPLAV
ncbi:MAG: histidine kinase [Bacteroidota bacterium]|nr:histidine kinase [Bacteroidota bacterium]